MCMNRYTAQRVVFGKPLLGHQSVHFRLAELETEVEALRSLVYRATDLYIQVPIAWPPCPHLRAVRGFDN